MAVLAIVTLTGSCRNSWGRRVRGNGNISTEERSVDNFKTVEVGGSINVYVSQGSPSAVKLEGDENILRYIEVVQEGDRLIVRNKQGYNLDPTHDMKIYVTSPVYNKIETSGASDIIGQGKITNPEDLELKVSGAGDIKMELDAPRVKTEVSGSGSVDLKGETKEVEFDLSGVGSAHCYGLLAESARVEISGAGSADIYASVNLDARVSGAGSVNYKGNPTNVKQEVSGIGSVSRAN